MSIALLSTSLSSLLLGEEDSLFLRGDERSSPGAPLLGESKNSRCAVSGCDANGAAAT